MSDPRLQKFMSFGDFCRMMESYWKHGFEIVRDSNGTPIGISYLKQSESTN